ncbi:hypothetical protein [Azospirillum sp.]|uniref:hypothetical protein n=1 Tax=Azospirillum sp. TaxID=34012 RepID=UPI002D4BA3DB|nr:hypothetical protein [Azospirillum sp.]HYD64883.1 hypothetical protein [Azospirillum sp.]
MSTTELAGLGGAAAATVPTTKSTAAAKKTDDKAATDASGAPAAKQDPAYTLSQSVESLLDGINGKKAVDPSLARAREAERIMAGVQAMSKAISEATTKAMDLIKGDMGKVLGGFGMSDDDVNAILGGFGKHMQDQMKGFDFNKVALDIQQSSMNMTLESRGMELVIQDGDRSVRISYGKSELHMEMDDQRLQASLDKGGNFDFSLDRSSTTVDGKATGMIVKANGFSDEEIQGIVDKLNGIMEKGGLNGLAAFKPEKGADGVTRMTVDLSVPLPDFTKDAAATTKGVDVKA